MNNVTCDLCGAEIKKYTNKTNQFICFSYTNITYKGMIGFTRDDKMEAIHLVNDVCFKCMMDIKQFLRDYKQRKGNEKRL